MMGRAFSAAARGSIVARLGRFEADALRRVAGEILSGLDQPDEGMRRLFPPAYTDDPDREAEFTSMTREELVGGKREAARAVIASIEGGRIKRGAWTAELDQQQAEAWLRVLNDARLVLGTRLDVTEDFDHTPRPSDEPDAYAHNLYLYLTALENDLVDTLAAMRFGD